MKYSFVVEETVNQTNIDKSDNKKFIEKVKFRNKISYLIISITFGISSLSDLAIQFYFKDVISLGPAQLSQMMSIVQIPWFMKPLFGLLTDLLPICGFRRKWYIIICGFIDFISFMLISLIKSGTFLFVSLLFIHNMCLSFQTVLGEAILVELSKLSDEDTTSSRDESISDKNTKEQQQRSIAKNYVSYFFFCKYLGSLFSSLFKGILVKHFSLNTVFLICSFIPLLFIISGIILLEIETTYNIDEPVQEETSFKRFNTFICQKHICIPIIFSILFVATPSYSDPLFYFLTESLKFDSIDLGIISVFSTIATLIAILLYRCYFKKKTFRSMIIYGSIVSFFVSFFLYLLVMRYNIKLGIPDFIFIIFSSSINVMLGELILMPLLSLAAVLSPKNLEGTSYSVFMSALNFGGICSNLLGSLFTTCLGITKNDFSNLPELILICNFLALVPLPFIFCLNKRYFDPEIKNEDFNSNESEIDSEPAREVKLNKL